MKLKEQTIVYLLDCTDGSTFVGLTSNLEQCLVRHFNGEVKDANGKMPLQIRSYIACNCKNKALFIQRILKSKAGKFIIKKNWL